MRCATFRGIVWVRSPCVKVEQGCFQCDVWACALEDAGKVSHSVRGRL